MSLPKRAAIPLAIAFGLIAAGTLFYVNLLANFPTICGRGGPPPWAPVADMLLFLPTVWITTPIDQWLASRDMTSAIFALTIVEELFLGWLYATLLYWTLRGEFVARIIALAKRRRGTLVAIAVVLIAISVGVRYQLTVDDYGGPLVHEAARVPALPLKTPAAGDEVAIAARHDFDVAGEAILFARSGQPPVVIAGDGAVSIIRGNELVRAGSFPGTSGEPRIVYGERDPYVVFGGSSATPVPAATVMSAIASGTAAAPVSFGSAHSASVLRAGDQLFATGYASGDLAIFAIEPGGAKIIGSMPHFSDHQTNNLSAAATSDGIIHLLAAQVEVPHDNSARMHHLRFDPKTRKFVSDDVLFVRPNFTSTITPRLVRTGDTLDAFWLPDGGSEHYADDGLYALRIGAREAWHLTNKRAEFAVLPDADGNGALLAGAAENPNEDGRIRWFLRRDNVWTTAGETDLGTKLWTMKIDGTEPFALWRDETTGGMRAAFLSDGHVTVVDLAISSAPRSRP